MATYTVTDLGDSGPGTLREAVTLANGNAGQDTIVLPVGTIILTSGDLDVTEDLIVQGAGEALSIIDGNGNSRIFAVLPPNPDLELEDLTIQNGFEAGNAGSAILFSNGSNLSMTRCTIRDCLNSPAILASGAASLTAANCTIDNNHEASSTGPKRGGGIWGIGCLMTIFDSTISNHDLSTDGLCIGGGIDIRGYYTSNAHTIIDTTITGNSANSTDQNLAFGGGLGFDSGAYSTDTLTTTNCDFTFNETTGRGGRRFRLPARPRPDRQELP